MCCVTCDRVVLHQELSETGNACPGRDFLETLGHGDCSCRRSIRIEEWFFAASLIYDSKLPCTCMTVEVYNEPLQTMLILVTLLHCELEQAFYSIWHSADSVFFLEGFELMRKCLSFDRRCPNSRKEHQLNFVPRGCIGVANALPVDVDPYCS
jgi:hypothetical protein